MEKKVLTTGIIDKAGSYLAELLIKKGYDIYGNIRRLSTPNISGINYILYKINLIEGYLTDKSSLNNAMNEIQPDDVYNLATQSFVGTSWNQPILTGDVTGVGAMRLLESVRHFCKDARVYQASSSKIFRMVQEMPQNEKDYIWLRA